MPIGFPSTYFGGGIFISSQLWHRMRVQDVSPWTEKSDFEVILEGILEVLMYPNPLELTP